MQLSATQSALSKFSLIVLSWGGFGVAVEVLGSFRGELIASSHELDCVGAVYGMRTWSVSGSYTGDSGAVVKVPVSAL